MTSPVSSGAPVSTGQSGVMVERGDSVDRHARALVGPPIRGGRLTGWLGLLFCLVAAVPPLVIELGRPDVLDRHEARALAISHHTAIRVAGGTTLSLGEQLAPSLNGRLRADEPPALHWLHRGAMADIDPMHADAAAVLWRGRLVSVGFALLTIAAVYWAALSIGGSYSAVFAALVCLASPLLLYEGRTADGAMVMTGWTTLAIAAALWAIRPLRPAPSVERQFVGWVVCGLAIAAAVLTAGLGAAVVAAAPILVMLLLCPQRQSHLMGLVAAGLVAALAVLPWAMLSHELDHAAWRNWLMGGELARAAIGEDTSMGDAGRRLGWMLLAVAPWTLWLLAALVQPFSTSSSGARTRLFLSWAWLMVAAAIYLSSPDAPRRSLLPVTAAGAVLVGQLFARYGELAAVGRAPRFWRLMRWPHVSILACLSVLPPLLLGLQPAWVDQGWLAHEVMAVRPLNQVLLVSLSLVLLLVLALSGRWTARHQPGAAMVAWAVWVVIYAIVLTSFAARSPILSNPVAAGWALTRDLAGDRPIYWLSERSGEPRIAADVLFYAGRPLRPLRIGEIDRLLEHHRAEMSVGVGNGDEEVGEVDLLLLADADADWPAMTQARATQLTDRVLVNRALWRLSLPMAEATPAAGGVGQSEPVSDPSAPSPVP
jgi:hypothetical protein